MAKVTILPAGQALGVTEQLPLVERHLYGEDYLMDSLAVRLGGRAAEVVVLGQGSTGAANDLAGATDLATRMVREFGLSDSVGPVGYPSGGSMFLNGGAGELSSRPFAEATQAAIDKEVARLLRQAEARATQLLSDNRRHLDELVESGARSGDHRRRRGLPDHRPARPHRSRPDDRRPAAGGGPGRVPDGRRRFRRPPPGVTSAAICQRRPANRSSSGTGLPVRSRTRMKASRVMIDSKTGGPG